MRLRTAEQAVIRLLAQGWTLKSHRLLDGEKTYLLHPLDGGDTQSVTGETVHGLLDAGLIDSNKKFPAATYLLTERGKVVADELGEASDEGPLTSRGWV
jgi:hypothetical protein